MPQDPPSDSNMNPTGRRHALHASYVIGPDFGLDVFMRPTHSGTAEKIELSHERRQQRNEPTRLN